jgi:hypothetical protein
MTSWAAHAPAEHAPVTPSRPPRQRPQQQRRPAAAPQRRVAGGVVWIAVFGALLAGVIAINVAGLQQRMRLNHLTQERAQLLSQINDTGAQLSAQDSDGRVGAAARRAGLVPASPDATSYLRLTGK